MVLRNTHYRTPSLTWLWQAMLKPVAFFSFIGLCLATIKDYNSKIKQRGVQPWTRYFHYAAFMCKALYLIIHAPIHSSNNKIHTACHCISINWAEISFWIMSTQQKQIVPDLLNDLIITHLWLSCTRMQITFG